MAITLVSILLDSDLTTTITSHQLVQFLPAARKPNPPDLPQCRPYLHMGLRRSVMHLRQCNWLAERHIAVIADRSLWSRFGLPAYLSPHPRINNNPGVTRNPCNTSMGQFFLDRINKVGQR